ncbi:thermonuclease family protein [Aneurinibacillus thermoaerophilus]|uniref:thermonuclease family protein n=1 Tax=Aneurinibacillus thermoaerophilus TaxID=143495 RepID=UPI002E1C19B4|nr:thermonuclease family protein [Aneurinibacillus thermoaerophilus]
MKKIIAPLIALTMLAAPLVASAHPGRTDANGGHTCRTNCEKWGLQPGEYHYHDANGNIIRQGEKKTQQTQKSTPKSTNNSSTKKDDKKKLPNSITTKVIKVIDGDTFVVKINNKEEKVRLIGVDTPETVHPSKPVQYYGPEASAYTKKRLEGKTVTLEFDVQQRDKYGRLLAYVWLGNEKNKKAEMFNQTLVKEGYAQVATFPPNVKYTDSFVKLQKEAREAGKGLWGKK